MEYKKTVVLKNGAELLLRNGTEADGAALLSVFNRTHAETDFLLTYPDENTFTVEKEAGFLKQATENERAIELLAFIDGELVGSAGFDAVGGKEKLKHRAEFGVSVLKAYWGQGIGTALTKACIECAKRAGYEQLELDAVAENAAALALYKKCGFVEFGRNPRGFRRRDGGYQELVHMRLEL